MFLQIYYTLHLNSKDYLYFSSSFSVKQQQTTNMFDFHVHDNQLGVKVSKTFFFYYNYFPYFRAKSSTYEKLPSE